MLRISKKNVKSIKWKGSYTLEAALISGVFLLVIFSVIFLFMGVLKRGACTSASCEAAVSGSTESVRDIRNGIAFAEKKIKEEKGHYVVSGSSGEIVVAFEDCVRMPLGNLKWNIKGTVKSKIVKPVLFIEKVRKIRKMKTEMVQ